MQWLCDNVHIITESAMIMWLCTHNHGKCSDELRVMIRKVQWWGKCNDEASVMMMADCEIKFYK